MRFRVHEHVQGEYFVHKNERVFAFVFLPDCSYLLCFQLVLQGVRFFSRACTACRRAARPLIARGTSEMLAGPSLFKVLDGGATEYSACPASIGTPHPCELLLFKCFEVHLVN